MYRRRLGGIRGNMNKRAGETPAVRGIRRGVRPF